MNELKFAELRSANMMRLPLFKNSKGEVAHSEPDGSDWSRSDWYEAVQGELGEYANWSKKYRRGDIDRDRFLLEAGKELADTVTYIDILAMQLGLDLGAIVQSKFNEVSDRVGCNVKLPLERTLDDRWDDLMAVHARWMELTTKALPDNAAEELVNRIFKDAETYGELEKKTNTELAELLFEAFPDKSDTQGFLCSVIASRLDPEGDKEL